MRASLPVFDQIWMMDIDAGVPTGAFRMNSGRLFRFRPGPGAAVVVDFDANHVGMTANRTVFDILLRVARG